VSHPEARRDMVLPTRSAPVRPIPRSSVHALVGVRRGEGGVGARERAVSLCLIAAVAPVQRLRGVEQRRQWHRREVKQAGALSRGASVREACSVVVAVAWYVACGCSAPLCCYNPSSRLPSSGEWCAPPPQQTSMAC